jgi:ABC-type transport system substrate-binding protein
LTYNFTIRQGVLFHDNSTLTAADVEYSIQRAMVRDRSGGPNWMWYVPLLGIFGSRYWPGVTNSNPAINQPARIALGQAIENAITRYGNTVAFHLNPQPELHEPDASLQYRD